MIKAVIFDLDNTLYDYDAINEKAVEHTAKWLCGVTGISYTQFQWAFSEGRNLTKKYMGDCASQHNRMKKKKKTSECLGLNPIKYSLELYEKYWGYMLDNMRLEKGAGRLLERLSSSGIKVAICTDLTTHIQHRKLRKLGIADYIDVFVSSEEAGAEKPDAAIFNMVIGKLDIQPDEACYVGDSYEKDMIGAGNLGMHPVWFNPHEKTRIGAEISNVLQITEMGQLEDFLDLQEIRTRKWFAF